MTTAGRHQEICNQFLAHAEEEYRHGDYLQAAEKAWGAFAHCMNSIAKQKGWEVGTRRRLKQNARRLIDADAANAGRLKVLLAAVECLHTNFYREFPQMVNDFTEWRNRSSPCTRTSIGSSWRRTR
ncbi:MAG: hypothetical protein OXD37_02880 [Acidimicrobiaceae bacterium]|nr:hypothetical protein [Acidimicrobiaceae bacterium]